MIEQEQHQGSTNPLERGAFSPRRLSLNPESKFARVLLEGFDWPAETLRSIEPGRITNVILDLNKDCNYKCLYCGNASHKPTTDSLTLGERKAVLLQAKELGATTVLFAGEGEPTMDPDLKRLVEFNFSHGLKTVIYTNASLLTDDLARFLSEKGCSLVIKADSMVEGVYNELTQSDSYHAFLAGLKAVERHWGNQLQSVAERQVSRIQISTVVNKLNVLEVPKIRDYCHERGYIFCCKTPGKKGDADRYWDLLIGESEADMQSVALRFTDREQTTGNREGKCSIASYGVAVTRTGEIAMCESVRQPRIGNVRDQRLRDLVQTKQELFKQYSNPACLAKLLKNGTGSTSLFGNEGTTSGKSESADLKVT